jgi:tetratricopeptide (TPR) repeat protein
MDMIEDAIKTYNAVIKLDPDNIPALYNKGILCKDQGQTGEAIKIFERILKKKPNFAPALQKIQELKSAKHAS